MANDYDKIIRENIESLIIPLLNTCANLYPIKLEEIPDELHTTIERKPDFLKRATFESEQEEYVLHIEFQTTNDPNMAQRMLEYCGLIHRKYSLIVIQYVVYIGKERLRMGKEIDFKSWRYQYHLINLGKIESLSFLNSNRPEHVLLAILGENKIWESEELIGNILKKIDLLVSDNLKKNKYVNQLKVLSRLRNLEVEVSNQIEAMPITYDIKSDGLYKMGLEEGIEKGMEKGMQKKARELVRNMLLSEPFKAGSLTIPQIAGIASVSEGWVKEIFKNLQNEELEN